MGEEHKEHHTVQQGPDLSRREYPLIDGLHPFGCKLGIGICDAAVRQRHGGKLQDGSPNVLAY